MAIGISSDLLPKQGAVIPSLSVLPQAPAKLVLGVAGSPHGHT